MTAVIVWSSWRRGGSAAITGYVDRSNGIYVAQGFYKSHLGI